MPFKLSGLWQNYNFMRLWAGQTISVFGSMVGVVALNLSAILLLHATAFQMALLGVARILPGLMASLLAGAWVDRLRLRPVLITADLGRAVLLATIPLAAWFHLLRIEQLYMVTFLVSILTIFFNVAYESYLPYLVKREDLVECNSKLSASASVSEIGGFSIAGWLVQLFTATIGILIDAVSFVFSAFFIFFISAKEEKMPVTTRQNIRIDIIEGIREVLCHPLLKASAICTLVLELSWGINGALVLLYMTNGLGFRPGTLGMIWAIGGLSSLIAAVYVVRINKRLGMGPAMITGLLLSGISMIFIPLAKGATIKAALLLIASQLIGDGAMIIYEINKVSLRQSLAPKRMLGRVNASMHFAGLGATLTGYLLGGILGEKIGVRGTLLIGAGGTLLSMLWLLNSPVRRLRVVPESAL